MMATVPPRLSAIHVISNSHQSCNHDCVFRRDWWSSIGFFSAVSVTCCWRDIWFLSSSSRSLLTASSSSCWRWSKFWFCIPSPGSWKWASSRCLTSFPILDILAMLAAIEADARAQVQRQQTVMNSPKAFSREKTGTCRYARRGKQAEMAGSLKTCMI